MSVLNDVREGLKILERDSDRLNRIDRYFTGDHDLPYMPDAAEVEYRLLADKCVTNWCPNLVGVPAQALFVDNFRRRDVAASSRIGKSVEMSHWQASRMDARQAAIYRSALEFGHAFTVTEKVKGKILTRGLSPRKTVALYEDPATDLVPVGALYRASRPSGDKPGRLIYWDSRFRYDLLYTDPEHIRAITKPTLHGASECPVTRFAAYVDLEGKTWGVVEPLMPVQDRINQTVFDLLVAQTYTSFNVRTATGMAPPMKMVRNEDGTLVPLLDASGNPVPDRQFLNASRWMYAADPDVKFGTLPAGDLTGFIAAVEMAIKHLSALSQTPPHFLLGQIANISAEALQAAETALSRKVEEFRHGFGESWERVFRLAAEIGGDKTAATDDFGEVIWRDMGASSLAQSADALGKFADSLEIPKEGLWTRVPGVTQAEIDEWHRIKDAKDKEAQLYQSSLGIGGNTADAQMMDAWSKMPQDMGNVGSNNDLAA